MNLYTEDQVQTIHEEKFAFIAITELDHVLTITLNREQKKNALHPKMIDEIAYAMQYAHFAKNIWMLIIEAKGSVFCAGADLKAMMGMIEENDSSIPSSNEKILIGELFNKIHKPTIAKVTGDVYAGGFFFLAGCNIVLANKGINFGLPEVKRGLFPFQVMAALLKVMPSRKVLDWCIRGYNLPVEEAEKYGLVTKVVAPENMNMELEKIIQELKQNSPSAIRFGLEAYDHIQPSAAEHEYLYKMLMKTIGTQDGQEGIKAFREKRKPNWKGE